ncbi:FliI/YscN family ATPase [Mucisphaera sp.]|uniref:FliI/YscN family ATPase n=1 Tax=Mucisphaera sp. TaxID=2913024 RepID=UPI003D0E097E
MTLLAEQFKLVEEASPLELRGTVSELRGLTLRIEDIAAPIGTLVSIQPRTLSSRPIPAEIIGFERSTALAMPLAEASGIRAGDHAIAVQHRPTVRVGHALLGRVINALGEPIDGQGPIEASATWPLRRQPDQAMSRPRIEHPIATGVRAVDAMLPLGRGQRIGVFAPPGLGKSTLLGTMARNTAAEVSVIALVGERGREVKDYVEAVLGPDGLARSVVVVATGDEPPPLRVRAAETATAIAEWFRADHNDVLLIMDSVTRYCQALRQIGLAAGEPPATKGFPPSVFANLPKLLERSGRSPAGSITGIYSVLIEGDELDDPVSEACRGVLDGHLILSRKLAERAHYPAIDVLKSISRVATDIVTKEHESARREVVKLLAAYEQVEDLLTIGAYTAGNNPDFDLAIELKPNIDALLQQGQQESRGLSDFRQTQAQIIALAKLIEQARLRKQRPGVTPNPPIRR